mmetsp:Transcript_6925/g.12404  ORF Transcript_6925/g.12404 Transcript_6925/m.12404 type:complete len:811 (-) Transcript_6925:704-3136(-)
MGCVSSSEVDPKSESQTKPKTGTGASSSASGNAQKKVESVVTSEIHVDSTSSASYSAQNNDGTGGYYNMFGKKADLDPSVKLVGVKKSSIVLAVHPMDDSNDKKSMESAEMNSIVLLTGVAMTMPYRIILSKSEFPSEVEQKKVEARIQQIFDLVDRVFNNWNDSSEISKVSSAKVKVWMDMSPELQELLTKVNQIFTQTQGRFDPTVEPLLNVWTTCLVQNGRPPIGSEVAHLKHAVGWDKRVTIKDGNKVRLENSNSRIDLCGISKGHAVDLLVNALTTEFSAKHCYVDWAGDIRALGKHPCGRPWRTAVLEPPELKKLFGLWAKDQLQKAVSEEDAKLLMEFDSSGSAIATSGDYFKIQKFGYHHIIDAATLSPMKAAAGSLGSVSIVAKTCAVADALATASMTFSTVADAKSFLDQLKNGPENASLGILGYCLIGRLNGAVEFSGEFKQLEKKNSQETVSVSGPVLVKPQESELNVVVSRLPRTIAVLSVTETGSETVKVALLDSVASCALNPPSISFHLKKSSKLAPTLAIPKRKVRIYLLSYGMQELIGGFSDGTEYKSTAEVDKRLKNCPSLACELFKIQDASSDAYIVLATMVSSSLVTNCGPRLVLYRDRFISGPPVNASEIGDSAAFNDEERLKRLMRPNPSPVCLITASGIDGNLYALTATSVRNASVVPSLLSFNVQKTNAFRSALGLKGSKVAIHFLQESDKPLAQLFTKRTEFDAKGVRLSDMIPQEHFKNGWPPLVANRLGIVAEITSVSDASDQVVFTCEVLALSGHLQKESLDADSLIYRNHQYELIGQYKAL